MSTKQNNLIAMARLSMNLTAKFMRPYSHEQAPKRYTQPQLMTCLVLKAYLKTTYRGVIEIIDTSDKLRDAIGFADRGKPQEVWQHETLESRIVHERPETNGWHDPVGKNTNSHDNRSRPESPESPDLRPAALAGRG